MPLPTWFTLTAERISADSRLIGHMVDRDYDNAQLIADIEKQIGPQLDVVTQRLCDVCEPVSWPFTDEQWEAAYPDESADARIERDRRHKSLAESATKELVIAAVYRVLPGEDSASAAKAAADGRGEAIIGNARIGSAESILTTLEKSVALVATRIVKGTAKAKRKRGAIMTGRGDIFSAG